MRAGIGNETSRQAIDATSTAARYDALIRVSGALRAITIATRYSGISPTNCGPSSGSAFWA